MYRVLIMIRINKYKFLLFTVFSLYFNAAYSACLNINYSCTCNAGYYAVNQSSSSCSCTKCPAGTYKTLASTAQSCTSCPSVTSIKTTSGGTVTATSALGSTSSSSCYVVTGSYRDLNLNLFSLVSTCSY